MEAERTIWHATAMKLLQLPVRYRNTAQIPFGKFRKVMNNCYISCVVCSCIYNIVTYIFMKG